MFRQSLTNTNHTALMECCECVCPLRDTDKYMFPSHSDFARGTMQDKVKPGHEGTAWEGKSLTRCSIAPFQHGSVLTEMQGDQAGVAGGS